MQIHYCPILIPQRHSSDYGRLLIPYAQQLAGQWGIYSLAHVAVPYAPDDPGCGTGDDRHGGYQGLPLGRCSHRGAHLLTAPLSQLMHMRHNPILACVERRVLDEIDSTLQRPW